MYNFVAANFSLLLALHRRIYASTSWPSMLRPSSPTAMLFNLNCVGVAEHEARDLTKRLEQPPDGGGLADAASDAVASEPRQVTWRRFAQAWNSVVLALRRGDLVSDAERDALCFRAVGRRRRRLPRHPAGRGLRHLPHDALEPVLLFGRPPPRGVVVVPVGRALPLQMRDLFGWCRLRHSSQFSPTPL